MCLVNFDLILNSNLVEMDSVSKRGAQSWDAFCHCFYISYKLSKELLIRLNVLLLSDLMSEQEIEK